jgi:hypothetical protein
MKMILYKYTSAKTATQILANGTLMFSVASQMNDPFETAAGVGLISDSKLKPWAEFKRNVLNDTGFRSLCLTRDPLSPLMWAHYADQHNGIVLGIDSDMAGLNDFERCVIPAQHGSMRYTRTKPQHQYQGHGHGHGSTFADAYNPAAHTFFERNFLFKSSEWHYEEEVRIVKSVNSLKTVENRQKIENSPPFGIPFSFSTSAIKEIYLGHRFYINDNDQMTDIFKFFAEVAPNATLFDAHRDSESWRMVAHRIDNVAEHLDEIFNQL